MVVPPVREITLQLSDGQAIACQQWYNKANPTPENGEGETRCRNILLLHGWLDNCRSFHYLAPELADKLCHTHTDGIHVTHTDVNIVAMDFVGHGLSSHKSLDGPSILLTESAFYVAEVIDKLGWWHKPPPPRNNSNSNNDDRRDNNSNSNDNAAEAQQQEQQRQQQDDNTRNVRHKSENVPFILVGHSMGASVACVMAASFPERVERLVLLDGAGPLDRPAANIAKHVRNHIERRQVGNMRLVMETRMLYPSVDVAVRLRRRTASNFPGNQYLSVEAAKEMVLRGSEVDDDGRVKFLHDPRLRWPSAHYFTQEQTEALYADIRCPVCLLSAQDGWPVEADKRERLIQILKPDVAKTLPGSHHFHADPQTAPQVASEVISFLDSN